MRLRSITNHWNEFFFRPTSTTSIAVFRIAFGMIFLGFTLGIFRDYPDLLGQQGVFSARAVEAEFGGGRLGLSSWGALSNDSIRALLWIQIVLSVFFILGFFTRISSLALLILLISEMHRNPPIFNGSENVMKAFLFILPMTHAGASLSLDRWLRLKFGMECMGPVLRSPWAQRLLQIQVTTIYFVTVCCKVRGQSWADGTALYYASRLSDYWRHPVPYLFEHLWTLRLMTWGTLFLELGLAFAVWIRELRSAVLLGGLLLHAGVHYSMVVPHFSALMVASYLCFVPSRQMDELLASASSVIRACAMRFRRVRTV